MRLLFDPFRHRRQVSIILILGGLYLIAAKLGLRLAFFHPSATPVWPPTGLALASLLIIGYWAWPGIFLGAFLANLTTAGTVWTSLGIATGNTLEGLLGAYLVNTYANGRNVFNRPQDIFKFAVLAGMVSTAVSATFGVTSLALGGFAGWPDYQPIWLTWWLGDAAGALIVAPLLILWSNPSPPHWDRPAILERALFLIALLSICWIVFGEVFPFPYLTVPLLVWAAFRFDLRETAAVIVVVAFIAIWGTVEGRGPFVGATTNESLLLLQAFMGIMAMVTLPLASVVAERTSFAMQVTRRVALEQLAREAADRAAERAVRLQAITSSLSEAVSRAQVVNVILSQGILALGARGGFVSTLTEDAEAIQLVGYIGVPEEDVSLLRRIPLSVSKPTTDVIRTGELLLFESDAALRARYPDMSLVLHDVARAVIPLSTAGRRIGVLDLNFPAPRVFSQDDQDFMLTLAGQCAQALERAQLYEHERNVARTLQRAFLPAALPEVPGIKVDAVYAPGASEAELGGDWYDVFQLPDGRIAVSLGDVVGSGLHAAIMMGQVRQSIRTSALDSDNPSAVLRRAGNVLRLTGESEGMATAIFGILDPVFMTFTYATAGHPPPALAMPGGEIQLLAPGGLPLGVHDAEPAPVRSISLAPGALLVLYTDGLTESTRNPVEGEQALMAAMRSELDARSSRPAGALLGRVSGGSAPSDDVAIVAISIAQSPADEFMLTLPSRPESLRYIRQAIRQLARALHLDEEKTFVVQLLVGEAVNNVVEHAYGAGGGALSVRVWRDGEMLKMEVSDHGRWRPGREEDRGRGLKIMRDLAETMEVESRPSGTIVRLAVSLAPSALAPAQAAAGSAHGNASEGASEVVERERAKIGSREGQVGIHPRFQVGAFEGSSIERAPAVIRHIEGIPIVDVTEDVDINNTPRLEEVLEHAARQDRRAVVVSLGGASFFDSKAIYALLRFGRRLGTNRQRLLLVTPRGRPARRILDITGLSEAFPVFDTVEEAIAALA